MVAQVNRSIMHPVQIVQGVSNAHCAYRSLVQWFDCINFVRATDPACGSGNFLTETYISLRRLENEILNELNQGQIVFGGIGNYNPIKVSISQFFGIEINDFAVTVAKTVLWIAESQMMRETENVVHMQLDFLPLKTNAYIVEGNAMQGPEQKKAIQSIFLDENGKIYNTAGKVDYVAAWYFKASKFIENTDICVAFVSTNSITQGEQVASVWEPLYTRFGIHINFAHKTFIWDSEASLKAHVHCVIVGFSSRHNPKEKRLYVGDRMKIVSNINPYLIEAEDYDSFISKEPNAVNYIKKLTGAVEFINSKERYCLWLVNIEPAELRKMPEVMKRVELCREDGLKGAPDRQKLADTPTLFREIKNPAKYIIVPRVSSENRRYIPLGFYIYLKWKVYCSLCHDKLINV